MFERFNLSPDLSPKREEGPMFERWSLTLTLSPVPLHLCSADLCGFLRLGGGFFDSSFILHPLAVLRPPSAPRTASVLFILIDESISSYRMICRATGGKWREHLGQHLAV